MAITEQQRHHLFQRLEEVLGTEEATTLMEHHPPVGWADVATKTDLDHLQVLLRTEFKAETALLRADMERGFREQTRTMVLANMGTLLALGSALVAAVRL